MTAADAGKSVDSVTPAGTEIIYNACFINGDKAVPYLATRLVFYYRLPVFHKFIIVDYVSVSVGFVKNMGSKTLNCPSIAP